MALVADLLVPFLVILVIAAPLMMRGVAKSTALPFWGRSLLGVTAVYSIMAIDLLFRLWGRFGLDYSTHTALAVS